MVRRNRPGMRGGFTLIELLVVIAIIAILVSITVPAVMQAIATADRARTASRLSQIGLAMHNYNTNFFSFPAGYNGQTTFYWAIRDFIEVTGDGSRPVEHYLCPARRTPASCAPGTAPADYGYGMLGQGGWGNSVLGAQGGVRVSAITNARGTSMCLLLGIIGVSTDMYEQGENDGPWNSNGQAYQRDAFSFKKDVPTSEGGMSGKMGGPFAGGLPFLFCDRSVRNLRYDAFIEGDQTLGSLWDYTSRAPIDESKLN